MARPADPHARSALVLAARREFVRHGLAKARIEDVTTACGLSKGAFYLHFKSKEALFGELVMQMQQGLERLIHARLAEQSAWVTQHGPVESRDPARVQPRAEFVALQLREAQHDRAVLELMWEWRDVASVLMGGAQGTEFDGVFWRFLDTEAKRLEQITEQLKVFGLCRPEIPSEVMAAMVMGTWLFILRRMVDLQVKPDLDFWVQSISSLLAEGTRPRLKPRRSPQRRAKESS
jgi:AcrR family transcriptional regulator